jgi:hypothetical protein
MFGNNKTILLIVISGVTMLGAGCTTAPRESTTATAAPTEPAAAPVFITTPPPSEGKPLKQVSMDWAKFTIQNYEVINNVWNKNAAIGPYNQEIFLKEGDDGNQIFGWKWSGKGKSVLAYPEVNIGAKPWDPPNGLKSDFPFAVGKKDIVVDFDVALKASGRYNMSFELWIVKALPPTQATISKEIMIWNHNSGMTPQGLYTDTIEVDGVKYDAFMRLVHGDESGANSNQWSYMAFVAKTSVLKGSLPLKPFIDYLVKQGALNKKDYIANLELGNEVIEGEGVAEIRRFNVKAVNPVKVEKAVKPVKPVKAK